jgi:hypothetical protein
LEEQLPLNPELPAQVMLLPKQLNELSLETLAIQDLF